MLEYYRQQIESLSAGLDAIAKYAAECNKSALNNEIEVYVARRDRNAHRMLKEILKDLRSDDKQDDRTMLDNLPDFTITWILDVATGECVEPKSVGRSRITNLRRDIQIAHMIEIAHDAMRLPYESDERYSACHEVVDCLGMKYGRVRTIWRKTRIRTGSPPD